MAILHSFVRLLGSTKGKHNLVKQRRRCVKDFLEIKVIVLKISRQRMHILKLIAEADCNVKS